MSKTYANFFGVLILALVFIYAFSASYTSDSIDNISYVIALAVDLSESGENLQVTFEFMDTSSFSSKSSEGSKEAIIDTVSAKSINSAINLLNAYIGKEVNLSHCKVIVFSDKLAKQGIASQVSELMNNIQVRPTTNIIICKGNAMEYIQKSTSQLEKILSKYYDIFPNSSEYTGFTSNIQIGEFYNYLTTKECGNLAILGGINPELPSKEESSSSSENSKSSESNAPNSTPSDNVSISSITSGNAPILGERGTENIGLAVLKNGVYIGDLTACDTLCHTLISGEVNSFLLSIDDKEIYKDYIDIALFENVNPKITVDTSNNDLKININIKLVGRISGVKNGINYLDSDTKLDLDTISNAVNKTLEKDLLTYLNKTTSEFKCDIDYFYNYAKHNFLTIKEWQDYKWEEKYLQAKFDVKVESQVYYSLLNSD